jgi:hypothetical protein
MWEYSAQTLFFTAVKDGVGGGGGGRDGQELLFAKKIAKRR